MLLTFRPISVQSLFIWRCIPFAVPLPFFVYSASKQWQRDYEFLQCACAPRGLLASAAYSDRLVSLFSITHSRQPVLYHSQSSVCSLSHTVASSSHSSVCSLSLQLVRYYLFRWDCCSANQGERGQIRENGREGETEEKRTEEQVGDIGKGKGYRLGEEMEAHKGRFVFSLALINFLTALYSPLTWIGGA